MFSLIFDQGVGHFLKYFVVTIVFKVYSFWHVLFFLFSLQVHQRYTFYLGLQYSKRVACIRGNHEGHQ